ncbi:MAG TPA: hypothetical protein VJZ03_04245 [Candidatus Bathyarchaeia archaeon]|nr:hypothetical protein [Candidatus Bathyarchaeia archaeon]
MTLEYSWLLEQIGQQALELHHRRHPLTLHHLDEQAIIPRFNFVQASNDFLLGLDFELSPDGDDYLDRKEIAELAGLKSVPKKDESNFDKIVGLFDATKKRPEVDVTDWVRSIRHRSP